MILAHKIDLDLTVKQREYFMRAAGCARFVWNLALDEWNRRYEAGEKVNAAMIRKEFNQHKYEAFPWMALIHRDAHAHPFITLQRAFDRFFNKKGSSGENKNRYKRPKFKKKREDRDTFYVANDQCVIEGRRIRLPLMISKEGSGAHPCFKGEM